MNRLPKEKQELLSKENLIKWYKEDRMSQIAIAKLVGVDVYSVRKALKKYNIETNSSKYILHPGEKYGKLSLVKVSYIDKHGSDIWECKCECGNTCCVQAYLLKNNKVSSCGCKRNSGDSHRTHNLCYTRIYQIYSHMKNRCFNNNLKDYPRYGGRGITICDEWLGKNGFINFYNWAIENGYDDSLTIDRIDVNGNYEPANCRWADAKTQSNNRRNTCRIKYNGIDYALSELAEEYGIPYHLLRSRIDNGWDISKALMVPNTKTKEIRFMNNVVISGRLVRDPEIRYSQGENATCAARFTIASQRDYKNNEGNYDADFISCTAFSKTAEFLNSHFHQGDGIIVRGSIRTGSFVDKDGNKKYTTDVNVDKIDFMGGKNAAAGSTTAQTTTSSDGFVNIPDGVDDGGLPFN